MVYRLGEIVVRGKWLNSEMHWTWHLVSSRSRWNLKCLVSQTLISFSAPTLLAMWSWNVRPIAKTAWALPMVPQMWADFSTLWEYRICQESGKWEHRKQRGWSWCSRGCVQVVVQGLFSSTHSQSHAHTCCWSFPQKCTGQEDTVGKTRGFLHS